MLPLRRRLVPILAVLLGAPVSAEFLQAYLSTTGDVVALVAGVIFFAPLYGGAALLIREVAVRTGRGWSCRLLLAAAFGTAMTGVIDLSLFGQNRADIPYWRALREPTEIDALGLSVAPALTWIAGHVVMSVGAPLAMLEALAPSQRGRPLLGRVGIPLCALGWLGTAVLVFVDGRRTYGYVPSVGQLGLVGVVIATLVVLALGPLGRPVPQRAGTAEPVPLPVVVLVGLVGKACLDLIPPTWLGVGLELLLFLSMIVAVSWLACQRRWGAREIGLLGGSAVLAGAVLGLTTPTPVGASAVGKYVQSGVLIVIALALVVRILSRASDVSRLPSR
jgi:hypothetical protein